MDTSPNQPIPNIHTHLPTLQALAEGLADGWQSGRLADWEAFAGEVRHFFTSARLADFEHTAPGWEAMADCAGGATLVHMGAIFASLVRLPEFLEADADTQMLAWWSALFHDIGKRPRPGERDFTHGFRSAAMTGLALPRLGFAVSPAYTKLAANWARLTGTATARSPNFSYEIQDNRRLPRILEGIGRLFGPDTPGALVVEAVLLHMSVNVVAEWPQAAPLHPDEERRYLRQTLLPLLKILMLTDSDAWALYNPAVKQQQRAETLAVFKRLESGK